MKKCSEEEFVKLSNFFKVFADGTRLKILGLLLDQKCSVGEIAGKLNMTLSAVSHQLKSLKELNLVKSTKDGQNVIYSLSDDHIETIFTYGIEHIREVK